MNIEDTLSAVEFRKFHGVPVHTLGETRETLAMRRDAMREVYGDSHREDWLESIEEFNDEETDTLTEDRVEESEWRTFGRALTCELVDSLED